MKLIFVDVETTGTDPVKHGLVQLAGQMFVNGKMVERFNIQSAPMPGDKIDDEALKVNGLTPLDLSMFQPARAAYMSFQPLLAKHCDKYNRADKFHFIGYNADFDADHVRSWFEKNGDVYFGSFFWWPVLDVSKLAGMRLMGKRHHLPNFKLMTVAKYCGIPVDENLAHNAMYDIDITMRLWKILGESLTPLDFAAAGI